MKSAIYQIRNSITNKFYIGSSINYNYRWKGHKSKLNLNQHQNPHLQSSWNKYGAKSFEFRIIEVVEQAKLIEREQFWIDWLKPEYNICKIAGSPLGIKHTEISKTNMSKGHRKGFKHTKEAKEKIGAAHKGKIISEETRANMSLGQNGNKNAKGLKRPYLIERNIANTGFKHSIETKVKISTFHKGKPKSEETKRNMSEAAKKRWKQIHARSLAHNNTPSQTFVHKSNGL